MMVPEIKKKTSHADLGGKKQANGLALLPVINCSD